MSQQAAAQLNAARRRLGAGGIAGFPINRATMACEMLLRMLAPNRVLAYLLACLLPQTSFADLPATPVFLDHAADGSTRSELVYKANTNQLISRKMTRTSLRVRNNRTFSQRQQSSLEYLFSRLIAWNVEVQAGSTKAIDTCYC